MQVEVGKALLQLIAINFTLITLISVVSKLVFTLESLGEGPKMLMLLPS